MIVGMIVMVGVDWGAQVPHLERDWIPCDGREVSKDAYPELFDIIDYKYSYNPHSSYFRVPDLRERSQMAMWICARG